MSDPGPIKFPPPRPRDTAVKLSLPRRRPAQERRPFDALDASAAARESINEIVSATRGPFTGEAYPPPAKLIELERKLRQLELTLAERERVITESETRLADRERDVAELEALLLAREELITASQKPASSQAGVSPEERLALDHLRAELEKQEASLKEAKEVVREREKFLDESEAKLFEKVQAQQEKENELEQREEDLRARFRRVREREATLDPQAAAALKAEDEAARKRDEFSE
jgi:hypothetical protein